MVSFASDFVVSRFGTVDDGELPNTKMAAPWFAREVRPAAVDMRLARTAVEFEALQVEWDALFARAGRSEQMFQTHAWLWHWCEHFLSGDRASLAIVTLHRSGRLVGVVPLSIERFFGLKQLVFMGAPVSQYGDAVIEDMLGRDQLLADAVSFAARETRASVVRLAKVREDAAISGALKRLGGEITGSDEALFVDLTKAASFDEYEQRFSSKARKNRRRLERRLGEQGAVVFETGLAGMAAADASRATLSLKRGWLKLRGQISKAFADPRTDAFFAAACAGEKNPCGAEVTLLRSGGQIANAAITINCQGRQALHILSLSLKFEKCAAGILHTEHLIRHAFENGVAVFDFLAPRHDYKTEWADGAVRVDDIVWPVTLAGRLYALVYLRFVREKLKAGLKARPTWLKAPLSFVQRIVAAVRA